MEELANEVYINDSVTSQPVKRVATAEKAKKSFSDAQLLMSICVDLEDQLWAMIQGVQIPSSVKNLWPQQFARTHTTFGRFTSMITITDKEEPLKLASLGLINEGDKRRQFIHY